MAKRLIKAVLFFPFVAITGVQLLFYTIKWFITGSDVWDNDPLLYKLMDW